ncbi:hypothetical protein EOD42_02880 [Rhodovarius crocodyli]|uniref:Uncharacterized protein n=1 Tax=Rhodovarius crocodyli TaxID=1979269 RepID=A0A437MN54_9PROT|nr:hypothetical protein [Rhodovarius crocodyli]RVT99067.1 hypothetical protein EOD42_02880 [Rhodovarius crocodyli]
MSASQSDPNTLNSFAIALATFEDGRLNRDLTKIQEEVLEAIVEAAGLNGGKAKGEITIALTYKAEGGVMQITGDIKTKTPKLARGHSVFWLTPENKLSTRNPRQADLPFSDVTVPRAHGLA